MPFIGSAPNKTFQRTDGTRTGAEVWQEAKAAAVKIRADSHDTHDEDLGDAISALWLRDGGNQPTADLPLNSFKFTGVGVATARSHFPAVSQVQDSTALYAGTSSGTDTITATLSPAITAYVAGQRYHFKAGGTNTGAATINFNSAGAKDIKKGPTGATALAAGDITTGGMYTVEYDGTNFLLLNPKFPAGFATTDSPQFSTIELGAASDTTLSRASAGVLAVEGVSLLRANQDLGDVSSAATAFANIKQAASDTATGVIEIATAAEMETATDTGRAVTPGRQHNHPGHPKFWASVTVSGGTPSLAASYNVTSISDDGTGILGVTIATDFSSTNWCCQASLKFSGFGLNTQVSDSNFGVGSCVIDAVVRSNGANNDPNQWFVAGFGDQ